MAQSTRIRAAQACLVLLLLAGGIALFAQLALEVISAPAVAGHHDFLAFHAAAQLVSGGRAAGHLYDAASITAIERHVIAAPVGAAGYMPYLTPPFGAALQAPLGRLSEPVARVVWLLVNIPLALLCCWLATIELPRRTRVLASVCLAGTFPFFQAFVEGQWSFVMLAGCLGALLAARNHRPAWAGVGLAVLALKPPLLIPVLVVLLCLHAWRTLASCVVAVTVVFAVTLPLTGWSTQSDYAGFLVGVVGSHLDGAGAAGAAVWHGGISAMEAVNGLVSGFVGQRNVAVLDGLTVVAVAAVVARWGWIAWRVRPSVHDARGRWVVLAGIAAALLTDLHLYPQDCVLFLVAPPLLTATVSGQWRLAVALGVAAFLDASWLDQLPFTPHVFTWLLAGLFLVACAGALRAGAPAGGAVRPRATVAARP